MDSGTSSDTLNIFPRLEKSFSSTARGTTFAGSDRVMGFCSEDEYQDFMRQVRSLNARTTLAWRLLFVRRHA